MWLRYGADQNNQLVAIEDVPSGKTNLTKPVLWERVDSKKRQS